MKLIKAKFRGQNGSVGYKTDQEYTLLLRENPKPLPIFPFILFQPKYPIEIWRTGDRGISNGYCPYASIDRFLDNWEIIKFL